jgi:hypothetical protein
MLSSSSLLVLAAFAEPRSIADVAALLAARADDGDCSEADVRACLERLAGIGLIQSVDPTANAVATTDTRAHALHREADALLLHAIDEEAAAARATGRRRLLVVPVDIEEDSQPLLSFGMLVAYATKHLPAAAHERLRLAPLWYTAPGATSEVLAALREWPTVLLFSCYAWNHARNQRIAAAAKRQLLSCVTVFGGPDVPKYEGDAERYFAMHPQVDIAVRGEGEATFAELLGVLAATDGVNAGDARLESVAGITFRRGDRVVRTPDRERIADLDSIPSPYLTGVYDHVGFPRNIGILLETNRGCPYGCTFCDWGSAILSRVRRFDLERVKQEMTWAAERGRAVFGFADANFGMLGRDVELAEWAVTLKRRYGVPNVFSVNYAKNKVDDLSRIVRTLTEEGILTQGLVSIQSIDPGVLEAVRRSNIKVERYDALATEFRSLGLTLFSDVMVGLPGSTPETLRADFQFGIDREIHVKAHPTQLLVNSPMNEPTYRTTYGITATPGELVTETSTFTRETWNEMMMMRQFFYFAERRGFLRQVATYVRAETGLHEMALYEELRRLARDDGRWPHLAYATSLTPSFVPPGSWAPLIEEVGEILVTALHVGDDDALATVLAVQHALFPFRGRRFPIRVPLQHDYVTWHGRVVAAKSAHGERWPDHVEPLRALGPGTFEVKDEANRCERCIGASVIPVTVLLVDDWELESPIARPNR